MQAVKKVFLATALLLCLGGGLLQAQTLDDLSRYSSLTLTGTARSMGMGGASSALGADFSNLGINPAGMAMYRNNQLAGSLAGINMRNSATYLDNGSIDNKFNLQLPQMGVVFANPTFSENEKGLAYYNFGIGYNQRNDFNRRTGFNGINSQSSYLDRIAEYAQIYGLSTDPDTRALQTIEEAAYVANAIVPDGAGGYTANLPFDAMMRQSADILESGRMNDWNVNGAVNISNRLYLGASLGLTTIRYRNRSIYTEESQNTDFSRRSFENNTEYFTKGNGVNAKVGAIYRVAPWIRISAAYHSPTNFNVTEEFSETFVSRGFPEDNYLGADGYTLTVGPFLSRYRISTPQRMIFGAAVSFQKVAMLTADYEMINYTQNRISGFEGALQLNNAVPSYFASDARNLRLGFEYNYYDMRFRLGYAHIGSVYKSTGGNDLPGKNFYTAGTGYYSPDGWFINMAAVISRGSDTYTPYVLEYTNRQFYSASSNFSSVNILFSVGAVFD